MARETFAEYFAAWLARQRPEVQARWAAEPTDFQLIVRARVQDDVYAEYEAATRQQHA